MPPQLHLIRHAQGYHNLCIANHSMRDPSLTPLGEQQCRDLRASLPDISTIDLIVASPIRRTLYTALQTFQPQLSQHPNLKIIALPALQEVSDLPCDTGSSLAELSREFANHPVDLSLVPEGWYEKTGPYAPVAEAIMARARAARRFLLAREERNIAVVTHGGLLHYLTEDWSDHAKFTGKYRADWGVPREGNLPLLPPPPLIFLPLFPSFTASCSLPRRHCAKAGRGGRVGVYVC